MIPFATLARDLSPLGQSLIHAWEAFTASPAGRKVASADYAAYSRALRRYLVHIGLEGPSTHREALNQLRTLNADMVKLCAHGDGDMGPFGTYRDWLVMTLNGRRNTMDEVQATLAFMTETKDTLEWGYRDELELKELAMAVARDLTWMTV